MDKILAGGKNSMQVTNDGATILKSIVLDNAAAKVLVGTIDLFCDSLYINCYIDLSKVQDDEVGDGTTSVTVLAAELLREAEILINKHIHPQVIIEGYREACKTARAALEASSRDRSREQEAFKTDLMNIARTTLSSKVLAQDKEHFARIAVEAILRLQGDLDLEHIQVIKKVGGRLVDSFLDDGFILDKKIGVNQPKSIKDAKNPPRQYTHGYRQGQGIWVKGEGGVHGSAGSD